MVSQKYYGLNIIKTTKSSFRQ